MSVSGCIAEAERKAQNRVIHLLSGHQTDASGGLGWRYLGDWQKRIGNANIEEDLLRSWLISRGYAPEIITQAITLLKREARMESTKLYEANQSYYEMLRYGVAIAPGPGEVAQDGIVVMGVRYQSPELGMYFMGTERRLVDVRWDLEDLGAISVYLEGKWQVIPAVHDRFVGMHFHDWMKVRRALRAKSASRKAWNQDTVFNAIDQIENLVKDRSMAFGIIDTTLGDTEFKRIEQDFFSSFRIDDTPRLQADDGGLGRVIAPRAPDADIAPTGSRADPMGAKVKPFPESTPGEVTGDSNLTPRKSPARGAKFGLPPKRND